MLRHPSAQKRHRQSLKRRERNRQVRSQVKEARKRLSHVIESKASVELDETLRETVRTISKAASKGVIHPRKASRLISRTTRRVNAVRSQAA